MTVSKRITRFMLNLAIVHKLPSGRWICYIIGFKPYATFCDDTCTIISCIERAVLKSQCLLYNMLIDRYMIWDFTSFSTVFQLFGYDGRVIMEGCVQWNPVYS